LIFTDIAPRTSIVITVTNGSDMQARFMSKVMKNLGDCLLVIPFRHKGSRINFAGNAVKIHLDVRDESGVLWSFKNCKIISVRKDGLVYHKLISPMKNGIENRRGGRRFYLWESAIFEIEGVNNPLFTNIRDVGLQGLSFVIDNKKGISLKEGTRFTCTLKNKDDVEMVVRGIIVRREQLERYMVYGCKLDEPESDYIRFVKDIERKNTIVDVEY